jgi:hypothetical protein
MKQVLHIHGRGELLAGLAGAFGSAAEQAQCRRALRGFSQAVYKAEGVRESAARYADNSIQTLSVKQRSAKAYEVGNGTKV